MLPAHGVRTGSPGHGRGLALRGPALAATQDWRSRLGGGHARRPDEGSTWLVVFLWRTASGHRSLGDDKHQDLCVGTERLCIIYIVEANCKQL